jgi:hypothetical protein
MPLCPQITNTPVTVTQTGDFVVTSVVPLIADSFDGLASNFESIEILADGKTKVYRANDEPTGAGINDGDLWIDLNDGNKLYVRAGGVWVSAQDASIGTAQAAANAAAADAAIAQADATEALADALVAYNAAVASLQPSANTIVNASNQITSISGNGINVFSGTGANSGPRVVLNSLGLAAYGTSSSFNITSASGNGTSVTYTATGHNFFVGQGVTVTELAPSGYNGSFIITAVAGSTFTVANTTTATVTDPNGFAIVSSVNVTNVSGNGTNVTYTASGHSFTVGQSVTVSGLAPSGYNGTFVITSVVASTSFTVANTTTAGVTDSNGSAERATFAISSTTGNAVFSGSITGSDIIGGTLNIAGNATINSSGLLTATGATITGTINAEAGYFGTASNGYSISATGLTGVGTGAITGGTIQTSSGSNAIILNGASNALQFKVASAISGNVVPLGTAGILMHYGATPDTTGTTYPKVQLSFAAALLQGSASYYVQSTNSGNSALGEFRCFNTLIVDSSATFNSTMFAPNLSTSSSATNLRVATGSIGEIQETSASSIQFKENVVDVNSIFDLDPKKLLDLPVRAFTYKEGYLSANDDRVGVMLPGFIAEEVDAIYPVAADYGQDGPHSWNERFIIPGLLALIQDLYKEVQTLKGE